MSVVEDIARLTRERDKARAEVERLRLQNDLLHDAAATVERHRPLVGSLRLEKETAEQLSRLWVQRAEKAEAEVERLTCCHPGEFCGTCGVDAEGNPTPTWRERTEKAEAERDRLRFALRAALNTWCPHDPGGDGADGETYRLALEALDDK